jgi:hypothetical protein
MEGCVHELLELRSVEEVLERQEVRGVADQDDRLVVVTCTEVFPRSEA